jgi:DNA-binding MurR/RpiR family transcriptional regulator
MSETPPITFDELQTRISERHAALSKRLQQVSQYVLEHTDSVAFDTLAEIAQEAGVHASTLVRFANAFGYSGFSDMQKLFKTRFLEEQPNYSERIRLLQVDFEDTNENAPTPLQILTEFTRANILSLEQLYSEISEESVNQAIDLLEQAQSFYVAGVRRSYTAAAYISYALRHIGCPTHLVDGAGGMFREQAGVIGSKDVLIGVSFKPYGEETLSVIRTAKAHGAKVILITDSKLNPAMQEADIGFFVHDAEVRSFRSLISTLCLAQSLCIGLAFRQEKDLKN